MAEVAEHNPSGDEFIDNLTAEQKTATAVEQVTVDPTIPRIERKALRDFKRDIEQKNVLIAGRWGVRGGISMHVSSTGSGKSVLQTQSALCFNQMVPCCGLTPIHPLKMWVIQSEDDEDRVAIDRDDVAEMLAYRHPDKNWQQALEETKFLDFTGLTGPDFIATLDNELKVDKPDAIIINPYNAYFGGDPMSHRDTSAFLKGGEMGRKETEGLEAVVKRHMVWCWMFAHTPKPPTGNELRGWLNDPYSCYKACGSSALPDAVRSIITFLKIPGTDNAFGFMAGKNGGGLGWTDAEGKRTLQTFFKWNGDGRHFWEDVSDDERSAIEETMYSGGKSRKASKSHAKPPMQPFDDKALAKEVFEKFGGVVDKADAVERIKATLNIARRKTVPPHRDLGINAVRGLLAEMAVGGTIRILPKGTCGTKGCMCGLPDVVDAWLKENTKEKPSAKPEAIPSTESEWATSEVQVDEVDADNG